MSRPDDTSTSKVHILSGLVRKRVIAGSTEEKELRRPFAEFLADGVMVLGVEMNALTVLASELFLPVALAFMLERMRKQGLGKTPYLWLSGWRPKQSGSSWSTT